MAVHVESIPPEKSAAVVRCDGVCRGRARNRSRGYCAAPAQRRIHDPQFIPDRFEARDDLRIQGVDLELLVRGPDDRRDVPQVRKHSDLIGHGSQIDCRVVAHLEVMGDEPAQRLRWSHRHPRAVNLDAVCEVGHG